MASKLYATETESGKFESINVAMKPRQPIVIPDT